MRVVWTSLIRLLPKPLQIFGNPSLKILKVAADQGFAAAQYNYGNYLQKGVGIDFQGAAHYFKLAADQGIAAA
jgi:TPR repeat protein